MPAVEECEDDCGAIPWTGAIRAALLDGYDPDRLAAVLTAGDSPVGRAVLTRLLPTLAAPIAAEHPGPAPRYEMCSARGLPCARIGVTDGDALDVQDVLSVPLVTLRAVYEATLPALFGPLAGATADAPAEVVLT